MVATDATSGIESPGGWVCCADRRQPRCGAECSAGRKATLHADRCRGVLRKILRARPRKLPCISTAANFENSYDWLNKWRDVNRGRASAQVTEPRRFVVSRCDIDAESVSDREPSPAGTHVCVTLQALGPPRRCSRARVPQADPLAGRNRPEHRAQGRARLTVIRGGVTHPPTTRTAHERLVSGGGALVHGHDGGLGDAVENIGDPRPAEIANVTS